MAEAAAMGETPQLQESRFRPDWLTFLAFFVSSRSHPYSFLPIHSVAVCVVDVVVERATLEVYASPF